MELVPILMVIGSVFEVSGATLLYLNSPLDVSDVTFDQMKDRVAFSKRRSRSRYGFLCLTVGAGVQLVAGLIWYQQPAKWS